jgi:aldehyde dehydrogenase (NAD+)
MPSLGASPWPASCANHLLRPWRRSGNRATIGAEIQLPFGGMKHTGLGPREAGGRGGALDLYTKWKVIYRDCSGRLQRAQIDRSPVAGETKGE